MPAIRCKHCGGARYSLNGKMRGKQRYLCLDCRRTFTVAVPDVAGEVKKTLAVVLYGTGKASFRYLSRLLNVCPATIMNWVKRYAGSVPEPEVSADLRHIELDEMWHFWKQKKQAVAPQGC